MIIFQNMTYFESLGNQFTTEILILSLCIHFSRSTKEIEIISILLPYIINNELIQAVRMLRSIKVYTAVHNFPIILIWTNMSP